MQNVLTPHNTPRWLACFFGFGYDRAGRVGKVTQSVRSCPLSFSDPASTRQFGTCERRNADLVASPFHPLLPDRTPFAFCPCLPTSRTSLFVRSREGVMGGVSSEGSEAGGRERAEVSSYDPIFLCRFVAEIF